MVDKALPGCLLASILIYSALGSPQTRTLAGQCADGVATEDELCYYMPERYGIATFHQAQAVCKEHGGELPLMNNATKNVVISRVIHEREKHMKVVMDVPPVYHYWYMAPAGVDIANRTNITFHAAACSDVHIALSQTFNVSTSGTYEIVIGGYRNTQSQIRGRLQGPALARKLYHHPNDCHSLKPYWISWQGGRIAVGSGNVTGVNEFMSYADPAPHPVSFLAVSGNAHYSAEYLFHDATHITPGVFWVETARQATQAGPITTPPPGLAFMGGSAPANAPQVCMALARDPHDKQVFEWRVMDCGQRLNFMCEFRMTAAGPLVG